MPSKRFCFLALLVVFCQLASIEQTLAQGVYQPPMTMPPAALNLPAEIVAGQEIGIPEFVDASATSNPMLWQQYQALQTGASFQELSSCQACASSRSSDYNRCGCNTELFPWISGPGTCDQWCVGPKWGVEAGGLMMSRDDADWNRVVASVGGTPTLVDQFEYGPGGRVFVTGYNDSGYGLQIGYEGINDWDATLALDSGREINYQSRLNSVEMNFLPNVASPWKWAAGARYIQLNEDFLDNQGLNRLLENRLFGFQLGARRDAWQFGSRVTLQTYANAGIYHNKFRREDVDVASTVRRDLSEIAFAGEAGAAAAFRLNHCTALRAGYQILALDGVGTGLEASFTPGLNTDTIIFHGLQFGLEYRR